MGSGGASLDVVVCTRPRHVQVLENVSSVRKVAIPHYGCNTDTVPRSLVSTREALRVCVCAFLNIFPLVASRAGKDTKKRNT